METTPGSIFSNPIATDKTAILSLLDEVKLFLNNGNIEKLLSLHSEDFVLTEPDMPASVGKADLRHMFQLFGQKRLVHTINYERHEVEVVAGWSYVRALVFVSKSLQGAELQTTRGKFMCLLKKQLDGSWLRTPVIVNRDAPEDMLLRGDALVN